jgi:hypothetical protein
MAHLSEEDANLLIENDFDPAELSDQEAALLLQDIRNQDPLRPPSSIPRGSMRYFRCVSIPTLSLHTAPASSGEVAPHRERFTPFFEKYGDETRKVGYLATKNERAIQLAEADPRIDEIDAAEHKKHTNLKSKDVQRAPY